MKNEKESKVDRAHQASLRGNLESNKGLLEEKLAEYADPTSALQVIYDLEIIKFQLEQKEIEFSLTPQNHLDILDRTEEWYKSRKLPYPQPARLKEQREFWKNRKKKKNTRS